MKSQTSVIALAFVMGGAAGWVVADGLPVASNAEILSESGLTYASAVVGTETAISETSVSETASTTLTGPTTTTLPTTTTTASGTNPVSDCTTGSGLMVTCGMEERTELAMHGYQLGLSDALSGKPSDPMQVRAYKAYKRGYKRGQVIVMATTNGVTAEQIAAVQKAVGDTSSTATTSTSATTTASSTTSTASSTTTTSSTAK